MLCTGTNSVVGQLYFKNRLIEKRLDLWLPKVGVNEGGGQGGTGQRQDGKLDGRQGKMSGGSDGKKNPPAVWEIRVQSLGWEDPLEEGMVTHYRILTWRIPMDRVAGQATVHGVAKSWTGVSD